MSQHRYHLYGVGNALLDLEFEVDDATLDRLGVEKSLMTLIDEARHDELLIALDGRAPRPSSGGSAANTMIACAQLGGDAYYSCKVADDETGTRYLAELADAGVDCNLHGVEREAGVTGKSLILITPDAERSMNTFLGITQAIDASALDLEALAASRYAYIEGYLVPEAGAREAALGVAHAAREAGVPVSLTLSDVNMVRHFRDALQEIAAPGLDMLFCNEEEARLMVGATDTDGVLDGLKRLARRFAMTRGAAGAIVFDGDATHEIPAASAHAVDSTGAGDIYAGTFLYGLTHDMPFVQCAELAGDAATTLITNFGARLSRDELRAVGRRHGVGSISAPD